MSFIYVYTNEYFNYKNTRKIGSTLNPFIRLNNYLTYYQDQGKFEYLFRLDYDNPYEVDEKIKNIYLYKNNTRNNGSSGGTEIYENLDIKDNILKCFSEENINYEEIDPNEPPITNKYSNNIEKELLNKYKIEMIAQNKKIIYNKYKIIGIPKKDKILEEIFKEFGGELVKRTSSKLNLVNIHSKLEIYFLISSRINDNISINGQIIKPINNVNIFNVPIVDYKCSLNETGRKKYGKINNLYFKKQSRVGTKYGHIELPEIRKSKYISSIFKFEGDELEEFVMEKIKFLAPNDLVIWNKKLKYIVLEYKEGDFFSEHIDNKKNKNHCGTLLIFPPAINEFQHTGGDFIIENDENDLIIPSWNNKDWKFVVFPTQLKHACHKVLSGRRIVIKTELFKKKNKSTFENISIFDEKLVCCDGGINYLEPEPVTYKCVD